MISVAEFAKQTRMVVHGGNDYRDEEAKCFAKGHPILSIEMAGQIRHFKCTSVKVDDMTKQNQIKNGYYAMKHPEACQLDRTYKALVTPTIPVVDLNHSVYMRNDETPPLSIYPTDDPRYKTDQTKFEISEEDKIGVIQKIIEVALTNGKIRLPLIEKSECDKKDQNWNESNPNRQPHPIQVASTQQLTLDLTDLNKQIGETFFDRTME